MVNKSFPRRHCLREAIACCGFEVGTLRYLGLTALAALLCLSASAQADLVVNLSKSQQHL